MVRDQSEPPMTGAEFRCWRERLGLSPAWLADFLNVRERTLGRWEYGHQPIPEGVAESMHRLLAQSDSMVDKMLSSGGREWLTFRTDRDYREAGGVMPASWHRAITARAVEEAEDEVKIVYAQELTEDDALD